MMRHKTLSRILNKESKRKYGREVKRHGGRIYREESTSQIPTNMHLVGVYKGEERMNQAEATIQGNYD